MTTEAWLESHFCEVEANYEGTTLVEFAKRCAPKAWRYFFTLPSVVDALKRADDSIRKAQKEIDELNVKGHVFLSYHIEPPRMQTIFKAFERVSPDNVKVVILGQDPTPQTGKATGRAFSVEDPRTVGSVMNVLLEVALEGWSVDLFNGDLSKWEDQGVLLLNSALTIGEIEYYELDHYETKREKVSHLSYWCEFTKLLIEYISALPKPSVWMLWGNVAQDFTVKRKFETFSECYNQNQASQTDITKELSLIKPKNYVLKGGHPSPKSGAGGMNTFFARNYFTCANLFLSKKRPGPVIKWGLVEGKSQICDTGSRFYPCPEYDKL